MQPSASRPAQLGLRYVGVRAEDMVGFLAEEEDVPWQSAPVRGEAPRVSQSSALLLPYVRAWYIAKAC